MVTEYERSSCSPLGFRRARSQLYVTVIELRCQSNQVLFYMFSSSGTELLLVSSYMMSTTVVLVQTV